MVLSKQPAVQLWSGARASVLHGVIKMLQRILAIACHACGACRACERIVKRQSSSVFWHCPEHNGYTREQIEEALTPLSFALEEQQTCFLILECAEQLLPVSGNALLKVLEEPPLGWHILLLCERPDMILATVRSRCVEKVVTEKQFIEASHELIVWLTAPSLSDWNTAVSAVDLVRKTPLDVAPVLDTLLLRWHAKLQEASEEVDRAAAHRMIQLLCCAHRHTSHQHASIHFWRSLLLAVRNKL